MKKRIFLIVLNKSTNWQKNKMKSSKLKTKSIFKKSNLINKTINWQNTIKKLHLWVLNLPWHKIFTIVSLRLRESQPNLLKAKVFPIVKFILMKNENLMSQVHQDPQHFQEVSFWCPSVRTPSHNDNEPLYNFIQFEFDSYGGRCNIWSFEINSTWTWSQVKRKHGARVLDLTTKN